MKKYWPTIRDYVFIMIAAFLQASSLRLFFIPANLASGGVSGISQLINHFTGWAIGLMILIGNIPLFALGWRFLGGFRFAMRTATAIVAYSLFTDLLVKTPLLYYSPMVGQVRMTGPDTTEGTALGYGMKKGFPFNQVVCIWVNNVQSSFLEPGKIVSTNHLAFYAPSADADDDGLPDPGAVPALCLPGSISLETRVPLLAPCTP